MDAVTVKISKQEHHLCRERQCEVWAIAKHLFLDWASDFALLADDAAISARAIRSIQIARIFVDEFQNLIPDVLTDEAEP